MSGDVSHAVAGLVLFRGANEGQRLEVIEESDGRIAIAVDGRVTDGWRWPSGSVEQCLRVYMGMLRN